MRGRDGRGGLAAGTPALSSAASAEEPAAAADESLRRLGVLAVASAISAVGQTPELATPLPFTNTSLAGVLQLEEQLAAGVAANLAGNDLVSWVGGRPGRDERRARRRPTGSPSDYERTVPNHELELVHDDGDLRFGPNDGGPVQARRLAVTTGLRARSWSRSTRTSRTRFYGWPLVSQPMMDLSVDIDSDL